MSNPVDYTFMKTGHSVSSNENNLTDEQEKNILSMITMFSSNAVINASKYVKLCNRNGITSQDMKNGLIFEVFEFTKRENFKDELEKTKKEYYDDDASDNEWEDVDENEQNILSDEELNPYSRLSLDSVDESDKDFITKYHNYIDSWETWIPSNSIEKIMRDAINNIKV